MSRREIKNTIIPFVILLCGQLFANKQLPVETDILWERDFLYIAPVDINNDSIDELMCVINDIVFQPFNQNLKSVASSGFFTKNTLNQNSHCGGSSANNSIWVSYNRHDSLFIYDLGRLKREMFVAEGQRNPNGYKVIVYKAEVDDINSDGKLEIVVSVSGVIKPRGIFVFDWESGKLLWKYLCGPVLSSFLIRDIDNDGQSEILCGTFAVNNGYIEKETNDFYTYVILLNSNGTLRWVKQIGTYSSQVNISWLETSQIDTLKIIACEIGNPIVNLRNCDSIFILQAKDGQIITRTQCGNFNGDCAVLYNNNSIPFIVIGGDDDTLRVLDRNLKLIRKRAMKSVGCDKICVGKFTGSAESEIAVATTAGEIQLYNLKLELLSHLKNVGDVPSGFDFFTVKFNNKTRLLFHIRSNVVQYWRLIEFNTIPFLNRGVPITFVIIGAVFLLFLFAAGMVYARYTKTRDIRLVIRGLTSKSGVIEMNHKGEINSISPRAKEILRIEDKDIKQIQKKLSEIKQIQPIIELAKSLVFDSILSSPQESVIALSQEQSYLIRCIRVKKGVLITFEDISAVEYMKRVTSWTPVAQKLAHGIKTPLMNIQLSAEQLESACEPVKDKTDKIIDGIKSEAKRLRKLTDNFMRFTQFSPLNLVSENINNILNDLCNKYTFSIPPQIKIECNLSDDLPKVMIDRKELETAISIIIENAIDAMVNSEERGVRSEQKKQDVLSVKTFLSEKQENEKIKKNVVIEISDTGKGIPEKYLNELFKPYFTYGKPEGTGLGLTLAKKIIEGHNGSIEIKSKENIGTTVTIFLPT